MTDQSKGEPVAWRYRYGDAWRWTLTDQPAPQWAQDHSLFEEQPLYTHPLPEQTARVPLKPGALWRAIDEGKSQWAMNSGGPLEEECIARAIEAAHGIGVTPPTRSQQLAEVGITPRLPRKSAGGLIREDDHPCPHCDTNGLCTGFCANYGG